MSYKKMLIMTLSIGFVSVSLPVALAEKLEIDSSNKKELSSVTDISDKNEEINTSSKKLDVVSDMSNYQIHNIGKIIESSGRGNIKSAANQEQRQMKHSNKELTGIFLPKGQTLTVTVKEDSVLNLRIAVGQYGKTEHGIQPYDSFDREDDATPMSYFTLTSGVNNIQRDDSGGMVYIENSNDENTSYTITLEGGNNIPVYTEGTTSEQDFLKAIDIANTAGTKEVPFFEFQGPYLFETLQMKDKNYLDEYLSKKGTSIEKKVSEWNQWVAWTMENYGFNEADLKNTRQRIHGVMPNVVISGAAQYATNEYIAASPKSARKIIVEDGTAPWGYLHEMGHTFQNNNYRWKDMTEVTVNISANYVRGKINGTTREQDSSKLPKLIQDYFSLPDSERHFYLNEVSDNDQWIRLGMFLQLARVFGDEFYPQLNHYYRTSPLDELPSGTGESFDKQAMQIFIKNVSTVTHRNMIPYFKKWGFDIKEETKTYCEQFTILEKDIWWDIVGTEGEGKYKIDSVNPYVLPTISATNIPTINYLLGGKLNENDLTNLIETKAYNVPENNSEITLDKVERPQYLEGTYGSIILRNSLGNTNRLDVPLKIDKGNAISLNCYQKEERFMFTLQANSQTLETVTTKKDSILGEGDSIFRLYDNNLHLQREVTLKSGDKPSDLIEKLSPIHYEEGYVLEIVGNASKKIEMYNNGEIALQRSNSKQEEFFKIENNQFKRLDKTPYHINGISLNCYKQEERFVFWVNEKEINTYTPLQDSALNSGTGKEFKVSLLDSRQGIKWNKLVNKEQKPSEVKEDLQNISYNDGDIFRIESISNGKIEAYEKDQPTILRKDSRKIEQFKIEGNKFIPLPYDTKITVKYVDEQGKSLSEDDLLLGQKGENFIIEAPSIKDYTFKSSDDYLNGSYDKDKTITLTYKKEPIEVVPYNLFKLGYWKTRGFVLEGQMGFEGETIGKSIEKHLELRNEEGVVTILTATNTDWYQKGNYDGYQVIVSKDVLSELSSGDYSLYTTFTDKGKEYSSPVRESDLMRVITDYTSSIGNLNTFSITNKIFSFKKINNQMVLNVKGTVDGVNSLMVYRNAKNERVIDGWLNVPYDFSQKHSKSLVIKDADGKEIFKKDNLASWNVNKQFNLGVDPSLENAGFQAVIPNEFLSYNNALFISIKDTDGKEVEHYPLSLK